MAITKKLIHFNKYSNFNAQKLSANRENTSYTVGVNGTVVSGEPYILYQSIVFIQDVLKIWTHGSLYDCKETDLSAYLTAEEIAEVYATIEALNEKQNIITDLETIRSGAAKGATALQSYTEKYTGTYSKPSTGIPKTDLASSVQTSLGKADTALQSYTETDPVFKASPAAGIKTSDITNWNSKTSNTGTVTGVKMNGTTKNPTSGVVDLGTVITAHQDISGKLDATTAASTYLSKTDAASTYLGKTAKAASATTADSATKATQDASGNVITSTYATKAALSGLQTQLDTLVSGDASSAIESFNEITAFLEGVEDTETLDGIIAGINTEIAKKADKSSAITNITRNGTTFTATRADGTTFTFSQQDNNTTYTFAGGTNKFTVTPSGGTAQEVAVTPSISNNVTYSGTLSSGQVAVYDGTAGKIKASGYTIAASVPSGAKFTDTTYSSKAAASGGTDVSLVTTGEKYTWNSKASTAVATASANGLMSSGDKTKMNNTNVAYGTCSTDAETAAKTVSLSGNTGWSLTAGARIVVKFTTTNTAQNPTLNVNGTGAKSILYGTSVITTGSLSYAGYASRYIEYVYDGSRYVFIGWSYDTNTTYTNASLGQGYGTCATAEATTAKVVTLSNYTLGTGGIVSVKFSYGVPAGATMNINSKGAKSIYHNGAAIEAGVIEAGDIATFIYSSQYHLIAISRATAKATASKDGLMSSEDKSKLNGIASGAEVNVQSDWNVTDTTSDAYIKNKPTIPSAVTESTVSGWGFTKNTGTYSKPSTGIPKTDLASAVQTSLGKADTALQSYTEKYTGTVTGVKMNGTTKNPTSGVVDLGTVITAHQDISGKLDATTAASTYLSKTDAASTYLGKTAKAASATTADSATKATQDASGNVITSTYATKTALSGLQTQLDTLVSGDASSAIESFNEITAFLEGVEDTETLDGIIAGINTEIAKKADKSAAISNITRNGNTFTATRADGTTFTFTQKDTTYSSKAAVSGGTEVSLVTTGEKYTWNSKASTAVASTSANGLMSKSDKSKLDGIASGAEVNVQSDWNVTDTSSDAYIKNKPTIPSAVTESTVSGWGFTKNTGTITGIKMNGSSKGTSGVVDLGTVITAHQDISGKLDATTAASTYATKTEVGKKQDKVLKFENVTASSWVSDSTYTDFPFRCDMACTGVTEANFAEVVFSLEQATGGNYAPLCATRAGIVSIWSASDTTITVPTVIITI